VVGTLTHIFLVIVVHVLPGLQRRHSVSFRESEIIPAPLPVK